MSQHNIKRKSLFFCEGCGHESGKWMGFCTGCGSNVPLIEAPIAKSTNHRGWIQSSLSEPQMLSKVTLKSEERISVGLAEMDRVLGGGVTIGSMVLFAGEPGIGKSTLLLQAAEFVASNGRKVLYISGEESDVQVKLRYERLNLSSQDIYLMTETNVDQIVESLQKYLPGLAIVDSVQSLSTDDIPSGPGSVAQVRECTLRLMRYAKTSGIPILITGHVTKDGTVAGPRILEHMVDVVLYLEGEQAGYHRLLRGFKNRFGSTNELGIFEMGEFGMKEIADPSEALLAGRRPGVIGSAISAIMEGSRPFLVEIQALTSPSVLPVPRRVSNGLDYNRMVMIATVMSRRTTVRLSNQDIIVNAAGGLHIGEPSADLAQALAITSSLKNMPVLPGLVAIGEVGLSGEIRSVNQLDRRINEAVRLGFSTYLLPESAKGKISSFKDKQMLYVSTLDNALKLGLNKQP